MRAIHSRPLHERPRPFLGRTLRDSFLAVDQLLTAWQARRRLREQLRQMPDYLRRDVGLTEEKVLEEVNKPFWRE